MKKLIIILMVFGITAGISQPWISLDMPELSGLTNGETVIIPVTGTDVIVPNDISSFYIYVEWDDAVLDYVDAALSPEMAANIGPLSFIFQKGNASAAGIETTVGAWIDTFTGTSFSMNPGDVFFNITATYVGDGSTVPGVGATELNFQFSSKDDESGKLTKGVTEIIDASFVLFDLTYDVPAGSINIPSGPVPTDWTGNNGDMWNDPLNWTADVPSGAPDQVVTIDETGKASPVIYGPAVAGILNLISGQLSVAPGGSLTTLGLFDCDGDLIIQTDASGFSGSFIDFGGLASSGGTGMFYMDRQITCFGDGDPNNAEEPIGWHYISAPIDGVTTDDMLDFYINEWSENPGMWTNYAGETPCVPYSPAESLDGMEVWSVKYDQLWPYDFTSDPCPQPVNGPVVMYNGPFTSLHTGPYSSTATFTAGTNQGWNMFANPYPSGLDMNAIVWDPAAIPGAAFYDGCPGNYGYWTPAIGLYSMPVGNGFFTEFTAAGTFSLTGTERAHNPDFFYKDEITSLLTLEATGDETSDITHIRFMDNAEAGFAPDGDFHKLFATTEGLAQIYTTVGDDKLAINALPATPIVPMGFTSVTSGEYTISAIETSDFANVVLEDRTTGEQTDLLTGSYTFSYTVNDDADRFFVHFTPLGIGDNLANSIDIWSNDHKIYVQAPAINGDIVVFNMMGQEVIRTEIEPGLNTIPVNDRNSYYVVKVVSSDVARTGKVYVK